MSETNGHAHGFAGIIATCLSGNEDKSTGFADAPEKSADLVSGFPIPDHSQLNNLTDKEITKACKLVLKTIV